MKDKFDELLEELNLDDFEAKAAISSMGFRL